MKIRSAIAIGCLAMFGYVQVADARSHHARRHVVKRTVTTNSGGVHVSTGDVNGDGTSDVVVAPKPKRKPK